MNRFAVEPAVFEQLPDYCVGVVVARGLDNHSQRSLGLAWILIIYLSSG